MVIHKWSLDTIDLYPYKKYLTNELMGELFFAVVRYAETGEKMPLSNENILWWPFDKQCRQIDKAKAARTKAQQE